MNCIGLAHELFKIYFLVPYPFGTQNPAVSSMDEKLVLWNVLLTWADCVVASFDGILNCFSRSGKSSNLTNGLGWEKDGWHQESGTWSAEEFQWEPQ